MTNPNIDIDIACQTLLNALLDVKPKDPVLTPAKGPARCGYHNLEDIKKIAELKMELRQQSEKQKAQIARLLRSLDKRLLRSFDEYQKEKQEAQKKLSKWIRAFARLSILGPSDMEVDINDPEGMAAKIDNHVRMHIRDLEALRRRLKIC